NRDTGRQRPVRGRSRQRRALGSVLGGGAGAGGGLRRDRAGGGRARRVAAVCTRGRVGNRRRGEGTKRRRHEAEEGRGMSGLVRRVVSAVRGSAARPAIGVIAAPRERDSWRSYPADGLTPQRLTAVLRAADAGDLTEQMALFEQMEEKDPHLFS